MENILETRGLSKHYGNIQAVANLDLQIPKGCIFGILGPNGSGKTTTLGMVLGVLQPTAGDFNWFGKALDFQSKRRIGAILEHPNFYPYLSGLDNLKIVARLKNLTRPDYDRVLEMVNLKKRAGYKFRTYSLGMKQRLAIAAALLSDPEVLVLDEPTNGLDPRGIVEVRSLIQEIGNQGITVIMSSHLLYEIEKTCTHVAVLKEGESLFNGSVSELTGTEGVIELKADNPDELKAALQEYDRALEIRNNDEQDGVIDIVLNEKINPGAINKFLAGKGVYVDHLVYRKNTLEKQFLELVENKAS